MSERKTYQSFLMVVAAMVLCSGVSCGPDAKIRKIMKDHVERPDTSPVVDSEAPNFRLQTVDGLREVELASFRSKKPVVLVFGSYT